MLYKAVVFDMDGVLIESEPFWRQAEREVFSTIGLELTEAQCMETTGLQIAEVVALRAPGYREPKVLIEAIVNRVKELVERSGKATTGAQELLAWLADRGVPCALASSSCYDLIELTLSSLQLRGYFSVVHSADDEPYGKPHPAVYLGAAKKLGIAPTSCLAIEDSLNGVIAARAARVSVVAIPEGHAQDDPRFAVADFKFSSLDELRQEFGHKSYFE